MWFRAFSRLVYGLCAVAFIVMASTAATAFTPADGTYVATPTPPVILHLGDRGLLKITFDDAVLQQLESDYHTYWHSVREPEHAYCIDGYSIAKLGRDTIEVHITSVMRAPTDSASPIAVVFECDAMPTLHTHPPSECTLYKNGSLTCVEGHPDLINCIPSPADMENAAHDFHRFGILQCGENTFTVFTGAGIAEMKAYGLLP